MPYNVKKGNDREKVNSKSFGIFHLPPDFDFGLEHDYELSGQINISRSDYFL